MSLFKYLFLVTILSTNPQQTEQAYSQFFHYKTVAQGQVSQASAGLWQMPGLAGREFLVMAPASGSATRLKFVQASPAEIEQAASGWSALELLVEDVDRLAQSLRASPFYTVGPPAWISDKQNVKAMQVRGPNSELVYLSQVIDPKRMTLTPVQARSPVDRPFMMVAGGSNFPEMIEFYRSTLGLETIGPFPYRIDVLAAELGLASDTIFELGMVKAAPEFAIELDRYPIGSGRRQASPILSITLVSSQSELGDTTVMLDDAPYDGAAVQLLQGAAGERIEILYPRTTQEGSNATHQ